MAVVLRQYSQPPYRQWRKAESGNGQAWSFSSLQTYQQQQKHQMLLLKANVSALFTQGDTELPWDILSPEIIVDLDASLERKFPCEPEELCPPTLTAEKEDRQKEQRCLRSLPLSVFGISKNLTNLCYASSVVDWSNCFSVLVGDLDFSRG